jgi:putative membrane-bound dehydrogenase-like protein
VCESVNYRTKLRGKRPNRAEGDRIVVLEDADGDGKADKETTFYQSPELIAPLGIAVAPYPDGPGFKVYVCHSPDILVFEDKDGDLKADGPPRKLLSGFRGYDHDHGVHGILIGPDNRLYFSVGDQGVSGLVDKHGRKWTTNSTDCRAGTNWRCDLDGTNLELLAHNFRNQYEPCVDSFGTVFVSDNDDDGNQQTRICYVMPGGNYGYHPRGKGESHWHEEQPGVVPKILRTYFGSPTGMCVYEGTLLPQKYRGQPLHTEAGPRHLRSYQVRPAGAGYDVVREDMVESSDNWFRPADVCVAPDGALFVADWYDPGVGGHGMGDRTRGRIYRVAPRGNQPTVPKVDLKSKEGITAALGSPNLAVRSMAMAMLHAMEPPEAITILEPLAQQKENATLRARALWQLGWVRVNRNLVPESLFDDPDPRFRVLAIRLWHDCYGVSPANRDPKRLQALIDDPSAAVRREALLALRDTEPAQARPLIIELAKRYDGKDRFYLAAVGIAVGQDKKRREAILADFDRHFPQWNETVAGLVWELRPPQVLALLQTRLGDPKLPADQRAQVVDVLAGSADLDAGRALLKALAKDEARAVREKIVEHFKQHLAGKWKGLRGTEEVRAALGALVKNKDDRLLFIELTAAAEDEGRLWVVQQVAADRAEPLALRLAAVRALSAFKGMAVLRALSKLVDDPAAPGELVLEAAQSLVRLGGEGFVNLRGLAVDAKRPLAQRQAAVAALSATREGTTWLLEAHSGKKLDKDLTADVARLLRNSPFPDLRNKALIAFPPPGKLDPKTLPSIPALLARQGNVERGRQLLLASFKNDAQCLKCHTVRGFGGNVGPDLSVIGSKASRENLIESILYPSRAVADQYAQWVVETRKGATLSGLLIEDRPTHLLLRDANGKDYKIDRNDLDSMKKAFNSLMPDNLLLYMSEEDLVDVVDYLHSLKTPALTPTAWHHVGPFEGKDFGMKRGYPPEEGIHLDAVYDGKGGKVRWRKVEPTAHGYVDVKALLGDRSDNTVSYLYCEIESPRGQEARVLLGTDEGVRLWVNSKLVHTSLKQREASPEQDEVRVRLFPGRNTLLLKVSNTTGEHGFYLTVVAEQELRLAQGR